MADMGDYKATWRLQLGAWHPEGFGFRGGSARRGTIQSLCFRELRDPEEEPGPSSSCSPAKLLHQGQSLGAFHPGST